MDIQDVECLSTAFGPGRLTNPRATNLRKGCHAVGVSRYGFDGGRYWDRTSFSRVVQDGTVDNQMVIAQPILCSPVKSCNLAQNLAQEATTFMYSGRQARPSRG